MAQSRAFSSLSLITLLLFSIANPPAAHATFLSNPVALSVTGQLCCTSTGNCPGTPIVGATVTLTCLSFLSFTAVVGTNTTTANGSFSITAPVPAGVPLSLPSIIPCVVTVQLPLSNAVCPVLSTATGVLSGVVQAVGTTITTVFGLTQVGVVVSFSIKPF